MGLRAPWLEAALQNHAAGRTAEAERICNDRLRAGPSDADALNLLGLFAAHRGRLDIAETLIRRAISLAPGRGDFYAALGNVSLMQGREGQMTECYRRALLLGRFGAVPAPFAEIASHAGSAPAPTDYLDCIEAYRSQCLQDVYLDRWVFGRKRNGVFVDIGAHDGITLSNTWFFEAARGWSGVCIEPNPSAFELLRANRHCAALNCCVAAEEGIVSFRKLSGYSEMLSGIAANYHPEHRDRIERELQEFGGTSETIAVPARTLAGIATEQGLSEIDYLSIDTEGGEFEILRSIPFDALRVHAITAECNFAAERPRTEAFMAEKGFDLAIVLAHDLVFVNRKIRA